MEVITKNDLRYRRTEEVIQNTFRDMLQEMEYSEITIKELTHRAQINRKTFYLHYLSLDALLGKLQNELMVRFLQPIATAIFPDDLEKIVRNFFEFSASSGIVEEKILCSKASYPPGKNPFESASLEICGEHECFPGVNGPERNIILAYLSGSMNEIHKQWVLDGRKIPLEDIIQFSAKLLSQGLFHSGILPEQ